MKTLTFPKFMIYCIAKSISHPRQPIAYFYCPSCKIRFNAKELACPKCGDKVGSSPDPRHESLVPWWGSLIAIVVGIICWATVGIHNQAGLAEVGRFLIYAPAGNLWGLSIK